MKNFDNLRLKSLLQAGFGIMLLLCCGYANAQTAMGAWNPVLYPAVVGTPGWEVQDNNATGSNSDPFASWSKTVEAIEAGGTNQVITILPDAFIESYDYDNDGSSETTLGHNLATELNITSAQNGLVINGSTEGCYTVFDNSSNGTGSLFGTIGGADDITIRGLYLLNGYAGAFSITSSTNVVFEDCIFDNNNLGAGDVFDIIAGSGSSVTFTRCKFINNNNGGNIVHDVTRNAGNGTLDLTFNECVWSCNSATSGGTAMKVTNGATAGITMNFTSCTFAENSSTGAQGGAIWFDGSETVATFTDTDFINNQISGGTGGGAMYIGTDDNVTMTGCNFFGNSSTGLSADGGALYAHAGASGTAVLNVMNTTFDSNSSGDDGGAVYIRNGIVTLENIHVLDNTAGDGVITVNNAAGNCTVTNYTCGTNSAPDGCLYQRSGTLTDNGGSATGSPIDLSAAAATLACGVYCAVNVPAPCLATASGSAICAATGNITVSGEVWEDINGNGIQESGDNGIANAYVLLYDSNSNIIGRTNTDAMGMYSFTGLPDGFYFIVFVNPDTDAHPNVAPANAGTESTDSDITNSMSNATDLFNASTADLDGAFTNVVLPVELLRFSAKKDKSTVLLEWATVSEINNAGFFIERRTEGEKWTEIGYIDGNGNTEHEINYTFTDENPQSGMLAYRLRQMDFDGAFAYSQVENVHFGAKKKEVLFYPVPVATVLQAEITGNSAGQGRVEIFAASGRNVHSAAVDFTAESAKFSVNVAHLPSGLYMMRLTFPDGSVRCEKLLKEQGRGF